VPAKRQDGLDVTANPDDDQTTDNREQVELPAQDDL
jgi:hypothetical protein